MGQEGPHRRPRSTNAEKNAACCVSLPMFPELTAEEVDYIIQVVRDWPKDSEAESMSAAQNTYTVVVVGMGKRGMHHATAFAKNPRFQVAGICDIDPERAGRRRAKLGIPLRRTDAAAHAPRREARRLLLLHAAAPPRCR